jgi:hypothetical protein
MANGTTHSHRECPRLKRLFSLMTRARGSATVPNTAAIRVMYLELHDRHGLTRAGEHDSIRLQRPLRQTRASHRTPKIRQLLVRHRIAVRGNVISPSVRQMDQRPPSPKTTDAPSCRQCQASRPRSAIIAIASIRFWTATPVAASVCWAVKPQARSRGPISALWRLIVVSVSERWP